MKLVILTNILAPYRIDLYEKINSLVDELTIVTLAEKHENRSWSIPDDYNFKVKQLPGYHIRPPSHDISIHINHSVIRTLAKISPDAVVNGGFSIANVFGFFYCKLFKKNHICWGELTLDDGAQKYWIMRQIRRTIISRSQANIGSSSLSKRAFLHYGGNPKQTSISVMPINVSSFATKSESAKTQNPPAIIQKNMPTILNVSRLIDVKGFIELFEIYARLLNSFGELQLIIAGEGNQRERYENIVASNNWRNVHFIGHQTEANLCEYYAHSDLFLFPTLRDPFGAVVSEALACRLLAVSSIHAAATEDLIEEGITGFKIDPKNFDESCEVIKKALELPKEEKDRITEAGYEKVIQHDFSVAANEIVEATRNSFKHNTK